jgi:uncharacterized repeat protein (TIGR03847 family)
MSESFELRDVDHFVADAVGPPGQRVFYLQAAQGDQSVTLRLEKQQVAALCEHLAAMMADLPEAEGIANMSSELREPVQESWVVGAMGVAYEQDEDRILLVAEEMVFDTDDESDVTGLSDVLGIEPDPDAGPGAESIDPDPDATDYDDNYNDDLAADFEADFDDLFGPSGILGGAATARFHVPRSLLAAFVAHGLHVTSAGRPPCELCGGPINPDGHICPRLN